MTDLVEAVARAICECEGYAPNGRMPNWQSNWTTFIPSASAVIPLVLERAALAVGHELAMVEMLNAEVAEPLWIEGLEHAHTRAVAAIRGLGEP